MRINPSYTVAEGVVVYTSSHPALSSPGECRIKINYSSTLGVDQSRGYDTNQPHLHIRGEELDQLLLYSRGGSVSGHQFAPFPLLCCG